MTPKEVAALMGRVVLVRKTLHRMKVTPKYQGVDYEIEWQTEDLKEQRAGWIVGIRHVQNGVCSTEIDEESSYRVFSPSKVIPCLLVSPWPDSNHLMVPLDGFDLDTDQKPISGQQIAVNLWNSTKPKTKVYKVRMIGYPNCIAHFRAETASKAKMMYARELMEARGFGSMGEILKMLGVSRDWMFDQYPVCLRDQAATGDKFGPGQLPVNGAGYPVNADQPQLDADKWNLTYAVGTPVRYWKGLRMGPGEGIISETTTTAQVVGDAAVVWVEDEASCIALTHVEPYIRGE